MQVMSTWRYIIVLVEYGIYIQKKSGYEKKNVVLQIARKANDNGQQNN